MKKISMISLICIIADRIIKIIVTSNMFLADTINIIKNFFRITYVQNIGAAWSMFSGNRIFLIVITLLALTAIYYFFIKGKELNNIDKCIYGILIGGIIGNLIDRVVFGYVIDYLDFNFGSYNFPIFNLADMCIVISGIFLVVRMYTEEK